MDTTTVSVGNAPGCRGPRCFNAQSIAAKHLHILDRAPTRRMGGSAARSAERIPQMDAAPLAALRRRIAEWPGVEAVDAPTVDTQLGAIWGFLVALRLSQ
jgi:hypothetical protein